MPIQKSHLSALAAAAVLACALPAIAQNLPGLGPDRSIRLQDVQDLGLIGDLDAETLLADQIANRYRIGVGCEEATEALRVHLHLEDKGLLVIGVLEGSPGDQAGIKRHDVIVSANGQPLASVRGLVVAVNEAEDTEMTLSIIRAGEEHTLKLTPEERDEEEIERLRSGFGQRLGQNALPGFGMGNMEAELHRAIEEMQRQFGAMPNGWRRMGPGIMFGPNGVPSAGKPGVNGWSFGSKSQTMREFESNGEKVSVTIERDNDKPAQIKVQRGTESWELTEQELDQLPKDVRALVESQLNSRGNRTIHGLMGPMGYPTIPRAPAKPRTNNNRLDRNRMDDRFDGVELRLKELQDAIRSIQEDK